MRKVKSIIILLLIACISFTAVPFVYASTNISIFDKADALNELLILEGNGSGDYMLDEPVLRSQAAAFITRLLGKKNYVLLNSAILSITKFSDVTANQWYAPYVGYCAEQGIIAGVSENSYEPEENISEKAFLKLLITSLGYEYGVDFSWSNVLQKAYELGLVSDSSYLTKTQDNLDYLREDVISAIYNALTKVNKKTKITHLQNLINEKIITREQAVATGLASGDTTPVSIVQVQPLSQKSVFVLFDKKIKDIPVEDILIYETGDRSKKLDISIQARQLNAVVINTPDQVAYMGYTIEIKNVAVEGGVLTSDLSSAFEGYRAAEVKSDFFKISKIVPVGNNTVNVYFTHPVNKNSEYASYYEILSGTNIIAQGSVKALTAKFAVAPNNMVALTLTGSSFAEGQQYTLKISGELTSIYGVKLNEGQGDILKFTYKNTAETNNINASFNMTKASLLDYKTLQLEFNMEVHPTRALQIYNYYITDPNGNALPITKAIVGGNGAQSGKIVYLTINAGFIKTYNYKVMINEINDISKQYSIIEKEYTFSGAYPDITVLNIQSVYALDKNTVAVEFDRPMDQITATTKEYYTITGISQQNFSTIPVKVVFDPESNSNRVLLYLPADKEVLSNYTYKLTVLSIMKDSLGNPAGVNREATFSGNSTAGAKPYISDAVIISKDTIKVTTSKDIALNMSNILAANYSLEYTAADGAIVIKVPSIVGYIDSRTLVLKFDMLDFEKEYTLKFNSLTDYSELYTRTAADGQNFIKVRLGR